MGAKRRRKWIKRAVTSGGREPGRLRRYAARNHIRVSRPFTSRDLARIKTHARRSGNRSIVEAVDLAKRLRGYAER